MDPLARAWSVFELLGYGIIGVFAAIYLGAFEAANSGWAKFKKALCVLAFIYSLMLIIGAFLGSKDAFSPLSGLNFSQKRERAKFQTS
ncbi:hypothetical protein VBZ67_09095 [Campylobacter concisus]